MPSNLTIFEQVTHLIEHCPQDENHYVIAAVLSGLTSLGTTVAFYFCRKMFRLLRRHQDIECSSSSILKKIHFYSGSANGEKMLVYTEKCMELLETHPQFVNAGDSGDMDYHGGYTPFLRACWNNNYRLIKFMLDIGAEIRKTNKNGETPLYLVSYRVSKSLSSWDCRSLTLLLSHPACVVNETNAQGNSPLHVAAKAGHTALARLLLLHGADPEIKNNMGYSPYKLAVKYGTEEHNKVAALFMGGAHRRAPCKFYFEESEAGLIFSSSQP